MSLLFGRTFVVGLEDEPDGALRVYIDSRGLNRYVLIEDERDKTAIRRAWAHQVHVLIPTPPDDAIYVADRERTP